MTVELSPEALQSIGRSAARPSRRVSLHLVERDRSELGRRLGEVAKQVAEISGGLLTVSAGAPDAHERAPALVIRAGSRTVIRYQAVPEGPEAAPFAEALVACASAADEVRYPELDSLGATELTVFIAASCPNCPAGVRAAAKLAAAVPALSVTIVDVAEFPEIAGAVGVRSVPTIVSGEGMTVVGAIAASELAAKLAEAAGPHSDAVRFASLVEAGRFAAAGELLAGGGAHDELLRRWTGSGMGGRIGLMMAVESALEGAPSALDRIVPQLVPLLSSGDAPLCGDTADLLGRIGHPSAVPALESLATAADEDLAEAAGDALDAIAGRARPLH